MLSLKFNFLKCYSNFHIFTRHLKKLIDIKNEDVQVQHKFHKISGVLTQFLGVSTKTSHNILKNNPEFLSLELDDIKKSIEKLKSLNYKEENIINKPKILFYNALTIENRHDILKECGCVNVSVPILTKYVTIMNRKIVHLKSLGILPYELNVRKSLENIFTDIEVHLKKECGEDILLKNLRQLILEEYFRRKLNATTGDLEKIWKTYFRIRHRSVKSIVQMIEILLNDLNFPMERILKNAFVLHGDPDNTKRLLTEIKEIGNENFHDILYRRPKIIMSNCDSIKKTIEHIKKFNIPESAIVGCLEILTLGPDTVLERLEDLNSIEEFQVLASNPRVLRLVHYQNKARIRLDYLNQLRVRCVSLNILAGHSDAFERFARDGTDKTKGRDVVIFLSKTLNKSESQIRNMLQRHPNWCHIPVVSIKHCYDMLIQKRFSSDDIYNNIHILLYPMKLIGEKLSQLQNNEIYENYNLNTNYSKISNREILTFCLYLIELEFHFTGDGMWTEQHIVPVENFHNILPDFPESTSKVYKYGMKPSKAKQSTAINP